MVLVLGFSNSDDNGECVTAGWICCLCLDVAYAHARSCLSQRWIIIVFTPRSVCAEWPKLHSHFGGGVCSFISFGQQDFPKPNLDSPAGCWGVGGSEVSVKNDAYWEDVCGQKHLDALTFRQYCMCRCVFLVLVSLQDLNRGWASSFSKGPHEKLELFCSIFFFSLGKLNYLPMI